MRFELKFDEEIFRSQSKLQFDTVWKKNLKKNNTALIWGLFFASLGVFLLVFEQKLGFLFLGFGIYYLYNFYTYFNNYKTNKKRFFSKVEKEVKHFNETNETTTWEFNEDYFKYEEIRYSIRLNWPIFEGFKIIENNLFLKINDRGDSLVLGSDEVGIDNFNKVISLVKKKITKNSQ